MADFIVHTIRHSLLTDTAYTSSAQWPDVVPFAESSAVNRPLPPAAAAMTSFRVLDACTGSGCIALALAAHLGCVTVGVDVADSALNLARDNLDHVPSAAADAAGAVHLRPARPAGCLTPPALAVIAPVRPARVQPPLHPRRLSCPPFSRRSPSTRTHARSWPALMASSSTQHLIALAQRVTRLSARGWPELVMEMGSDGQVKPVTEACRRAGFDDVRVYDDHAGKKRWVAARRGSRGSECES